MLLNSGQLITCCKIILPIIFWPVVLNWLHPLTFQIYLDDKCEIKSTDEANISILTEFSFKHFPQNSWRTIAPCWLWLYLSFWLFKSKGFHFQFLPLIFFFYDHSLVCMPFTFDYTLTLWGIFWPRRNHCCQSSKYSGLSRFVIQHNNYPIKALGVINTYFILFYSKWLWLNVTVSQQ